MVPRWPDKKLNPWWTVAPHTDDIVREKGFGSQTIGCGNHEPKLGPVHRTEEREAKNRWGGKGVCVPCAWMNIATIKLIAKSISCTKNTSHNLKTFIISKSKANKVLNHCVANISGVHPSRSYKTVVRNRNQVGWKIDLGWSGVAQRTRYSFAVQTGRTWDEEQLAPLLTAGLVIEKMMRVVPAVPSGVQAKSNAEKEHGYSGKGKGIWGCRTIWDSSSGALSLSLSINLCIQAFVFWSST